MRKSVKRHPVNASEVRTPAELSLDNLWHFTPGFGLLLGESQPGGLVLGQRRSGRVSASLAFLLQHGRVGELQGAAHCKKAHINHLPLYSLYYISPELLYR